jgi:hypothetical protein
MPQRPEDAEGQEEARTVVAGAGRRFDPSARGAKPPGPSDKLLDARQERQQRPRKPMGPVEEEARERGLAEEPPPDVPETVVEQG